MKRNDLWVEDLLMTVSDATEQHVHYTRTWPDSDYVDAA